MWTGLGLKSGFCDFTATLTPLHIFIPVGLFVYLQELLLQVRMYPSGLKPLSRVNLFHSPLISLQQWGDEPRRRSLSAASYHGNVAVDTAGISTVNNHTVYNHIVYNHTVHNHIIYNPATLFKT